MHALHACSCWALRQRHTLCFTWVELSPNHFPNVSRFPDLLKLPSWGWSSAENKGSKTTNETFFLSILVLCVAAAGPYVTHKTVVNPKSGWPKWIRSRNSAFIALKTTFGYVPSEYEVTLHGKAELCCSWA